MKLDSKGSDSYKSFYYIVNNMDKSFNSAHQKNMSQFYTALNN